MPNAWSAGLSPSAGEAGLASWAPSDLAAVVLPAWDDFVSLAGDVDLDGRTRVKGWSARDVCVHLGSWPGSRSFDRMRAEAERDDLADVPDFADHRSSTFDQEAHNEAVIEAGSAASRTQVLAALQESRDEIAAYLSSADATRLGRRLVRSMLGPLPLSTLVGAGAYELAVHALDLASSGAPAPSPALLSAGLAALVDTAGALAARCAITAGAGCQAPEAGWGFAASPAGWTTLRLPAVPPDWPIVHGNASDLLDASAGRRAVPPMLARRDLQLQHPAGLLALAPIVEAVPGLPGGAALRIGVRSVRGLGQWVRHLPGAPR